MSFFNNRKVEKNYDFFGACSWYTPGISGMFMILALFLAGMVLASVVCMPMILGNAPKCYLMLVMYPVQFVPLLIYVKYKSSCNSTFDRGYALDSNHFGKVGGAKTAVMVVIATFAMAMMLELINHYLPEMSDTMKEAMKGLTTGPLWVNLLCAAVFAPILEEWMCRGVLLRGLLNHEMKGKEPGRKMSPALAIAISALFFAVIHGNLWQGITAFIMGCLLGYVYFRTGSLKTTILMHCANNALSVMLSHFGGEEIEEAKSIVELIPAWEYAIIFIVSAAVMVWFIKTLNEIPLASPQGNSDVIPNADDLLLKEKEEKEASVDQNILNN